MAPLFFALDRQYYTQLVVLHLSDVWQFPTELLAHLQKGAFAVSARGISGHEQAIDEAHETIVNRQTKAVLNRADASYIEAIAHYPPYRAQLQENFLRQIISESCTDNEEKPFSGTAAQDVNVKAMLEKIDGETLFCSEPTLRNVFTGKVASAEEKRGMLECHAIGTLKMENFFQSRVLQVPSVSTQVRQERLRFMGTKKRQPVVKKSKANQLMILALKAQLVAAQQHNATASAIGQQYSLLPAALVDDNGCPRKGTKAKSRAVFTKRYANLLTNTLPENTATEKQNAVAIIDGMFILQSAPLSQHKILADYVQFLISRWVTPKFAVANAVHLLFDHPGRHGPSPKDVERRRRDTAEPCSNDHSKALTLMSPCPKQNQWRALIACRVCKRSLVRVVAWGSLLLMTLQAMRPGQSFLTAGGFDSSHCDQAWKVAPGQQPQAEPAFFCNHEEADTRV